MQWLEEAGYEHYEISNFAKPGWRSRHNSSYWSGKKYLGIGPSAHSFNKTTRQWNIANNNIYIESINKGEIPFEKEVLTREQQLTTFKDFPILNASAGNNIIVFEQAGYLHTYTPGEASTKRIKVGIAADLLELRSRYAKGSNYVRSADISPTGQRVVFDFRGDIVTLPAEKGDARNLTQTTSAHEKYPAWSPDGKNIAYFSDASGEYQLHIKSQDGKEVRNGQKIR